MKTVLLFVLVLIVGIGFDEVRDEIRQLRWDYEFEHHEKNCNFAEVCPVVVPNPPSHVSVQ